MQLRGPQMPDDPAAFARVIEVVTLDEAERRAVIDTLTRLLATGRVIHRIAERLPLAQIADAHARIEQGQVVGNIVLALD